MTTLSKTLRYGKGYEGKIGKRAWVAKITGTDQEKRFARTFVEPAKVVAERPNRDRTMVDLTWTLEHGLYEQAAGGERKFFLVHSHKDTGATVAKTVSAARAKAIADLLDLGREFEAARVATKEVT